MFAKSLRLVLSATLALSCSAWQLTAKDSQSTAFALSVVVRNGAGQRKSPAICRSQMVATGSSNDAPAGSAQSYMKKIPPHLQGLALRNQKKDAKDYGAATQDKSEAEDLAAIQAELDEDEEDVDHMDYAMMMIDELDKDDKAPEMRSFDLDIQDAEVLRTLRDKMHNDDFKQVFGRGVGELL